jgi:hypothetical protein
VNFTFELFKSVVRSSLLVINKSLLSAITWIYKFNVEHFIIKELFHGSDCSTCSAVCKVAFNRPKSLTLIENFLLSQEITNYILCLPVLAIDGIVKPAHLVDV